MVDVYDLKSGRIKIVPITPTEARYKMYSLCTYRKLLFPLYFPSSTVVLVLLLKTETVL